MSPWVERNLDGAQYAQPRGSQYEGPKPDYFYFDGEREEHDRELEEAREHALDAERCTECGCPIGHWDGCPVLTNGVAA